VHVCKSVRKTIGINCSAKARLQAAEFSLQIKPEDNVSVICIALLTYAAKAFVDFSGNFLNNLFEIHSCLG
jgi:hypothetical protein